MVLWNGRITGGLDPLAWQLNSSLSYDQRLFEADITASIAWAEALEKVGVIDPQEMGLIREGLCQVREEFKAGTFTFQEMDEDIHTAVERRLTELIGRAAGKLHTGRSRNDQVATDLRMWMIGAIGRMQAAITGLQGNLVEMGRRYAGTLMPGYTHLQRAQPVTLGHWLMSFFWMLERDADRFNDLEERTATCPLGSGALAGTALPVDREALASALGFGLASPNSMDAVSDRDFVLEYLFDCALLGIHISRLAEGVILYSSAEFGFFHLADAYSTGSSLMPQKRNPDPFENARGKTGVLIGLLAGLMATLKSLPSAYDKDLQEDKPAVFNASDILFLVLPVMTGALGSLQINPERMLAAIDPGMMATDLADALVARGIPFREAHTLCGKAVAHAEFLGRPINTLSLEEWRGLGFPDLDFQKVFDPQGSVERRGVTGGTAPASVQEQVEKAGRVLQRKNKRSSG